MKRIETLGSIWVIDEGCNRYCRFPKTEAGRERPEWGNAEAGLLQDAVWHDYDHWEIKPEEWTERPPRLVIRQTDGRSISAPYPAVL